MPTRRPSPFLNSARHTIRMELVLEYTDPVSLAKAQETARRVLEGLHVSVRDEAATSNLQSCHVLCHDLRQRVSLLPTTPTRE
ncbi:MAG: hypothetical protein ABFE16_20560 [Armatimonadia bacterium]